MITAFTKRLIGLYQSIAVSAIAERYFPNRRTIKRYGVVPIVADNSVL